MATKPTVGGSTGTWGTELNAYLDVSGYNLAQLGLSGSTTDIKPLLDTAAAASNVIIIPANASAYPMLSTWTATDVTLVFMAGARISLNMATTRGMVLTRCTLVNASFTSSFTGPASAGDYGNYGFPAREILLHQGCTLAGTYYHEYSPSGVHVDDANVNICETRFYRFRHRSGWASCIHIEGSTAFNVHAGHIYAKECDRAIEIEAGAHDITFSGGGYFEDIYPNGYTGQPSTTANADAAIYATYTSVMDGHTHSGEGGVSNIRFNGEYFLDNCGAGVTFSRSTGSNDSDLPRNCTAEIVHLSGRTLASGSEAIQLNGYFCGVDSIHFELGGGVTSASRQRVLIGPGKGCFVGRVFAESGWSGPVVEVQSTHEGADIGTVRCLDGRVDGGSYIIDIAGAYTKIERADLFSVGSSNTGYIRFQATADSSSIETYNWSRKSGETWLDGLVDLSQNSRVGIRPIQGLPPSSVTRAGKFLSVPQRAVASNQVSNNVLRTCPFYLPWSITIDQIGCEIVTAGDASSVMRLGIFDDNSGLPGSPLADVTVAADAVASPMATLGAALTLAPGWYHSAAVPQGAPTTAPFVRSTTVGVDDVMIFNPSTLTTTTAIGYSKSGISGALAAYGSTIASVSNVAVRLWFRVA